MYLRVTNFVKLSSEIVSNSLWTCNARYASSNIPNASVDVYLDSNRLQQNAVSQKKVCRTDLGNSKTPFVSVLKQYTYRDSIFRTTAKNHHSFSMPAFLLALAYSSPSPAPRDFHLP